MKPICVTQPQPTRKSLMNWQAFYAAKRIPTEVEKGIDHKGRTYYKLWRDLSMGEEIQIKLGMIEITRGHSLIWKISEKTKKPKGEKS